MSSITENTLVVRKEYVEMIKEQYNESQFEYRINNFEISYEDEDFAIFIFDCDGCNPWYDGSFSCPGILVNEINYGDTLMTEINNEEPINEDCITWIEENYPGKDMQKISSSIEYTI